MTLDDFRKNQGWSYSKLADAVGASHATIARRWCLPAGNVQRKIPHPTYMSRIVALTGGLVQPNSFYDVSPDD